MPEAIPPIEAFHNSFYHFVETLEILAKDAEAQCEAMGDYNVAWELYHDVGVGEYLANSPQGQLSTQEASAIISLVRSVKDVPASELQGGAGRERNLSAMQHPAWLSLRAQASSLLTLLGPAIARNQSFLGIPGPVR
jgi:hypothetical protein